MAVDIGVALAQTAQLITDALAARAGGAGAPPVCAADERDLTVPGALIGPDTITYDRLDSSAATVTWTVWLVERDNGPHRALTGLSSMLAAVVDQLGAVSDVRAQSLLLPNHAADPLPGLQLTLTTEVTED